MAKQYKKNLLVKTYSADLVTFTEEILNGKLVNHIFFKNYENSY